MKHSTKFIHALTHTHIRNLHMCSCYVHWPDDVSSVIRIHNCSRCTGKKQQQHQQHLFHIHQIKITGGYCTDGCQPMVCIYLYELTYAHIFTSSLTQCIWMDGCVFVCVSAHTCHLYRLIIVSILCV